MIPRTAAACLHAALAALGRRDRTVPAAAAMLAAAGAGVIASTLAVQQHAPQPPLTAANTAAPPQQPSSAALAGAPGPSAPPLDYAAPTRIQIPAIKVNAAIIPIGLHEDGSLQVPVLGPDYDKAAWYTGSAAPGQAGTAVIEGHLDSARSGPSVFYRLGAARPGDVITIIRADHHDATYRVDTVRRYPKSAFPTDIVYRDTDIPTLRLITCAGHFDADTHHYTDNTVVSATLTSSRGS
ncbi:class F sortase [Actinomadura litoris]|uniref:class F sortase n=1 Tax=Actinomadura litoris TaxID=2678616 RepID=UPI001FA711C9|nr:class F sortase [Actinomadura litoris]